MFSKTTLLYLKNRVLMMTTYTKIVTKTYNSILLAPVAQKVDNAIHRINYYPADNVVCFVNTYPLDSDLSDG